LGFIHNKFVTLITSNLVHIRKSEMLICSIWTHCSAISRNLIIITVMIIIWSPNKFETRWTSCKTSWSTRRRGLP